MKKFDYPVGSIVELLGHDSPHCGVVVNDCKSVELIAQKDEIQKKMTCQVILVDLTTLSLHPITNKAPIYKLRQLPSFPWETSQLKSRIKTLKPKYQGGEYHIIYNNCQHFAWELSTGKAESPDADKFGLVGGLIGWTMHVKDFGSNSSASICNVDHLSHTLECFLQS